MNYLKSLMLFTLLVLLNIYSLQSQNQIRLIVDSANVQTTCTDFLNQTDIVWGVNVNNNGWINYYEGLSCYESTPNINYDSIFNCSNIYYNEIEVCFQIFEADGGDICNPTIECYESYCQTFILPDFGEKSYHNINIDESNSSSGTLYFTIESKGSLSINDEICNAVYLGSFEDSNVLGNIELSNYTNECATNLNEPSPSNYWTNDYGVWFKFKTSNNSGSIISMSSKSDPQNIGNDINMQIALYESENDSCTGNLQLIAASPVDSNLNCSLLANCLNDNSEYYILVDGSGMYNPDDIKGYFSIQLIDSSIVSAGDTRCQSKNIGKVKNNEVIHIKNNTNSCATNLGDPNVVNGLFGVSNGVWYQFKSPNSGNIIIKAISNDSIFGLIDIEMALYHTINDECDGQLILDTASYNTNDYNEEIELNCLDTSYTYWLLIDGSSKDDIGTFDLFLIDGGKSPPYFKIDTTICQGDTFKLMGINYSQTGTYRQYIPISNRCDSTIEINIKVDSNFFVNVDLISDVICYNQKNGSAYAYTNGNPVNYIWSNGETDSVAIQLEKGWQTITIEDINGCIDKDSIFISGPDSPIEIEMKIENKIKCFGDNDGSISASANGGFPPYIILWNNGQQVTIVNNLYEGIYSVSFTDTTGCTVKDSIYLSQPDKIEYEYEIKNTTCYGDKKDGEFILYNINGGVEPYYFELNDIEVNSYISNLIEGKYKLNLIDSIGCNIEIEFDIYDPDSIWIESEENIEINSGQFTKLNVFYYPTSNLDYKWSPNKNISCNDCPEPGTNTEIDITYNVIATDTITGCSTEKFINVVTKIDKDIYIPNIFSPNDDGYNDTFLFTLNNTVKLIKKVSIFTRWGAQIYNRENLLVFEGWDGKYNNKPMDPGVYVYLVQLEFNDGKIVDYKGSITLKR